MRTIAKIKKAAEEIGEPISELTEVFEDLLKEYQKPKILLKDKILVARELSKIADVLLKKERKERSAQLKNMESLYDEIASRE